MDMAPAAPAPAPAPGGADLDASGPGRSPSPEPSPLDMGAAWFDGDSEDESDGGKEGAASPRHDAVSHGPGTVAVDFGGLIPAPGLLLREDVRNGCGGRAWPAGMLLGRHLLRHRRHDLGDSRILELGAGGGLVGLAVAKVCTLTSPVVMTDMESMVPLMNYNIGLNHVEDKATAAILNWGEPLPHPVRALKPDLILAADLAYLESSFPLLLQTFSDLLELNRSASVYFCQKRRRRADLHFIKSARKAFRVAEIEDDERPLFERERMFLLELRSRRPEGGEDDE